MERNGEKVVIVAKFGVEMGKCIGEAWFGKKELDFGYGRVRLQIYGRHPSGNSRQAIQY